MLRNESKYDDYQMNALPLKKNHWKKMKIIIKDEYQMLVLKVLGNVLGDAGIK